MTWARAEANGCVLDGLAKALLDPAANGFEVYYQPIVCLRTRATLAVEALARWRHELAGSIDPEVFVLTAEREGMMAALDDFVLERACTDAPVLTGLLGVPAAIHVNICASCLGQSALESSVARALDELRLAPEQLILEITETSRIGDLSAAAAAMQRMRMRGVRFALDDFGSGFNMLVHLHALPVDCIKLDAALTNIDSNPLRTEAVCRSVMTIGQHLGATVIAEGIETTTQMQMLARLGCHLGQGHLFGCAEPLQLLSDSWGSEAH